jgi:hypothetical protein
MTNDMPSHPERDVFNPFLGETVPIDVDLATLVARVWQRGIRTSWSCQDGGIDWSGHEGKAYIAFPTVYDAKRFLEIAAGDYSEDLESLYNRVVLHGSAIETEDDWYRRRRFTVEGWAADLNRDYDEDGNAVVNAPPEISLTIAVYFPRDDIASLEKQFLAAASPSTSPETEP